MKGIARFFVFFLFFVPFGVGAEDDQQIPWSEMGESCFEEMASFSAETEETLEVKMYPQQLPFFVQGETILPYKIFQYGSEKYLPYTIITASGVDTTQENLSFLNDGNRQTEIAFDPYLTESKEIFLDANQLLEAGHFNLQMYTTGDLKPRFFISKDKSTFIEVRDVEDFDFRYLKIRFENPWQKAPFRKAFSLQELNIILSEKNVYVVNPENPGEIHVYSNYQCETTDTFRKKLQVLQKKSQMATYRVSAETPVFEIEFENNPTYNNDFDGDGIQNQEDNCPFVSNPNQKDEDQDLLGDVCDYDAEVKNASERDSDADGIGDRSDNCPYVFNPQQLDSNADRVGDVCADDDGDSIIGYKDNCPFVKNPDQKDINSNGIGDACEFDKDNDGIFDSIDNCIVVANPDQKDTDSDGIGDACDNCEYYNPRQSDVNQNGEGDVCEEKAEYREEHDDDKDTILNEVDNCVSFANPDQKDTDSDGIGDVCDNCPQIQNNTQEDRDKNGTGDLCEDTDDDGIEGYVDNCVYYANADQADADNDGRGDVCEDDDFDGVVAVEDNCPFRSNADQRDIDNDGVGDACDTKDNRLLESNKWIVVSIIACITLFFGGLIFGLLRKLKK